MLSSSKKIWFLTLSFLFIALNCYFIAKERFEFLAIPAILLIAYLAIFKMDSLVKLIIFLVPLSVSLNELEISQAGQIDMALPTEPILFGLMIIFIIKLFQQGSFDKKIIYHPVTITILINLMWIGFTCIPSVRPLVSIKFLLSRIWLLATFYFIMTQLFKDKKNMTSFFWLYIIGFTIVIVRTLIMHSFNGFDQKSANWIMSPFFNDHTSYGACIAFILPFIVSKLFDKEIFGTVKVLILLLFIFFIVALVLSYTRAAWVSVIGALGVYLILKLKIKWWFITTIILFVGVFVIGMWSQISIALESNKQDSSTDLKEHVSSISNVSSDASNLERFNRWNSAIEMFKKKPFFGWGPGVYAFEYAPFQKSYDKTIISTNAGDGGNAHSEYLGPLSESGILGFLSMLSIIVATIFTGVKVYKRSINPKHRTMALIALLGLVSYYLHGILNNFLDTDKISSLFWGMTAIIVVLDVYFLPLEQKEKA